MISLNINQKTYQVDADPDMPLLWAIRDIIGLTGTKQPPAKQVDLWLKP